MGGNGNAQGGPVLPGAETRRAGTRPQAAGSQARGHASDLLPIRVVPADRDGGGGGSTAAPDTAAPARVKVPADDKLTAAPAPGSDSSSSNGIDETAAWKPASRTGGGGAMPPRGGSGNGALSSTVAAVQGRSPRRKLRRLPPRPQTSPACTSHRRPSRARRPRRPARSPGAMAAAQHLQAGSGLSATPDASGSPTGPTITENPSSTPYSPTSGGFDSPLISFPYYPLYTLDYIQGNVLFPGGEQLATLDGNVDLRAQVKNTTGVTFSWNTSGLTNATNIVTSGTNDYDLTFTWDSSSPPPRPTRSP